MTPGPLQLLTEYVSGKYDVLLIALWQQCQLVLFASVITLLLGVVVGVWMSRRPRLARILLRVAGTLYTIPILATFALLIPLLGIGQTPALVALVMYGMLPVLHNTYAGLRDVDPAQKLAELMAIREPLYRGIADVTVATDGRKVQQVVDRILREIQGAAPG